MSLFSPGTDTSTTASSTSIPTWISDAWYNLYNQANDLAQNPYQVYQGPQVAALSAPQLQAIQEATTNVGNYQPNLNTAGTMFGNAGAGVANVNALYGQAGNVYNQALQGTNSGLFDQAAGLVGNAASNLPMNSPFMAAGGNLLGQASNYAGASQPYLQHGTQLIDQSTQAPTGAGIAAYMNPYQQNVIDATMAQLNQQFGLQNVANAGQQAMAGAFGGSRAAVQNALTAQGQGMTAASTLGQLNSQNYSQALQQFNAQQQLGLQGAGQTSYQAAMATQPASILGNLAGTAGSLSNAGYTPYNIAGQLGGTLSSIGTAGLQPSQLQANIGAGLAGLGTASLQPLGLLNQVGTNYANLGVTQQQLGQADVASLMGTGAVQQGQTQTSYNTAYQNFLNQIQWPYQQLGYASNILQGVPTPTSQTTTQTTPTSSTGSQLLGLGIGAVGALGKLGVL